MVKATEIEVHMNEERKLFDVSNEIGRTAAYQMFGILASPRSFLTRIVVLLFSSYNTIPKEIETQRRAAIEIIRAGKDSNVEEMEITMSEQAGLNFTSAVEGLPVDLKVKAGKSGTITMKVKYK